MSSAPAEFVSSGLPRLPHGAPRPANGRRHRARWQPSRAKPRQPCQHRPHGRSLGAELLLHCSPAIPVARCGPRATAQSPSRRRIAARTAHHRPARGHHRHHPGSARPDRLAPPASPNDGLASEEHRLGAPAVAADQALANSWIDATCSCRSPCRWLNDRPQDLCGPMQSAPLIHAVLI